MTYQDQCSQRGVVCIREIVNKGVQRVAALDIIIDPYSGQSLSRILWLNMLAYELR